MLRSEFFRLNKLSETNALSATSLPKFVITFLDLLIVCCCTSPLCCISCRLMTFLPWFSCLLISLILETLSTGYWVTRLVSLF